MNLKEYLGSRDLSAKRFAESAGLPVTVITRFLRGDRGVSPASAAKISEATRGVVTIQELLYPGGFPENAKICSAK